MCNLNPPVSFLPTELLKEYLKEEKNRPNLRLQHRQNVGFYSTNREMQIEMGKHRRNLLAKVATLYKKEKEEFYEKYRYFQLHKWEILKVIKA